MHKTQPHLYTWLIWSIVTTIALAGQWTTGAGPGAWPTAITALLTYLVTILALRYGTKDITTTDSVFLIFAVLAIIPWWLTNNLLLSVILATAIDVCAYAPTIRKTWRAPESETLAQYSLSIIRHAAALAALSTYSLTTYLYPVAVLIMNTVVVGVILRPKSNRKS